MRVLIVTGVFGGPVSNPWLLDDLAAQFARTGDSVDVVVADTKNPRPKGVSATSDGVTVVSVGPTRIRPGRVGKLMNLVAGFSGLHLGGFRFARKFSYDLVVYTSIGLFSWGLPARLRARGIAHRSVFVLWDFFPIHQYEIGRISHWLPEKILRSMEALTFRNADAIAVMTPANERFFRLYHNDPKRPLVIIPPWAADPAQYAHSRQREGFTVVFGGQLAPGRGVDTLLHAASILQQNEVSVDILILGDGPSRAHLEEMAGSLSLTNTTFLGSLPRDDYQRLLATVHVGIAITVPGVTPPTFPSKIAEYCAHAVPTIVCVEAASDAGAIVEDAGAGLAVQAGDAGSLADSIRALAIEHAEGRLGERSRRARELFEDQLSARVVVERLRSTTDPSAPTSLASRSQDDVRSCRG